MVDSIFQKAAALVADQSTRSCGQAVTFRRGSTASPELTAVVGSTGFRGVDAGGVEVVTRSRDYFVDAADLLVAGAVVEPRAGDQIAQVNADGDTVLYTVTAPNGEAVFRYVDERETRVRIHTQRADIEVVI